MGEITEALQRARREREAKQEAGEARDATREAAPRTTPDDAPVFAPDEPGAHDLGPPAVAEEHAPPQHISRTRHGFWQARAVVLDNHSPVAERYRHLALHVRRVLDDLGRRSFVVTSAVREEGKTVTACNLALALASVAAGRRVALVDLDLRRHSVSDGLEIQPAAGIEAVLRGEVPLEYARVATDVGDLDVYPVRRPVQAAHELLAGPRMAEVAAELEARYALVVCDSPPVLPVPDVPLLLQHFGGALAVTRSRRTRRSSFEELLALIPPSRLLGSVLNDAPRPAHAAHYDYYGPRKRRRRSGPSREELDQIEEPEERVWEDR